MKNVLLIASFLVVGSVGYWLVSPLWRVEHVEDAPPLVEVTIPAKTTTGKKSTRVVLENATPMRVGSFAGREHEVSGVAKVFDTEEGMVLRFEDFNTTNGPDLRVYLATDATATDFVDLGELEGTSGNINYDIPDGADITKYNHVLVWCRAFGILFGEAVFVE